MKSILIRHDACGIEDVLLRDDEPHHGFEPVTDEIHIAVADGRADAIVV
jgi:hypothetical protein